MTIFRIKRMSSGKCPKDGCIRKDNKGNWRVISNKTGRYWTPKYSSKNNAKKALSAYHSSK